MKECDGSHRFFVASTIGVEAEGKAVVIIVCTACGESFAREFKVSSGHVPLDVQEK